MTAHPEDLHLAGAPALEVTLYTRPACHLCEEAKAAIEALLEEFGASLREVNIDGDRDLVNRYGSDIPVLFIGARKAAKHRVNLEQFRRHLEEAREKSRKGS
jgi:glutaredoxin